MSICNNNETLCFVTGGLGGGVLIALLIYGCLYYLKMVKQVNLTIADIQHGQMDSDQHNIHFNSTGGRNTSRKKGKAHSLIGRMLKGGSYKAK